MKFWHVLSIVNHPMLTVHGLLGLNSFSQNMDLDISGYKNQTIHFLKNVLSKIMTRLKDCTLQEFFSTLKSQSKLRTYSKCKLVYEMEPYTLNPNFKQRQAVSKLRISDHKLQIELGRYHKPSLELSERICPFCLNKIEDEYHFITECPMYNDERHRVKSTSSLTQTSDFQFFTNIFNCHKEFMKRISCFILEITDKGPFIYKVTGGGGKEFSLLETFSS